MGDSIRNNVLLGDDSDVWTWLRAVCFDEEVREMEDREDTVVGNSGVRLRRSGGAPCSGENALPWKAGDDPDDPFSALDRSTEKQVFEHLKELSKERDRIPDLPQTVSVPGVRPGDLMEHGTGTCSTHEKLMAENKTVCRVVSRAGCGERVCE